MQNFDSTVNWHVLRKGRLTASNLGYIFKAKRVTPSLIKRVLGEYKTFGKGMRQACKPLHVTINKQEIKLFSISL